MGSALPEILGLRQRETEDPMLGGFRATRITGGSALAGLSPEVLQWIASQGANAPVSFQQGDPNRMLGVSGPLTSGQIVAGGQTSAAPPGGMPGATGPVGWVSPEAARAVLELFGPLFGEQQQKQQQPQQPALQQETNRPGQLPLA